MQIKERLYLVDPGSHSNSPEFLAKIISRRSTDIRPIASIKDMLAPTSMMGLDAAANIVSKAVTDQKRILIVGDYDCDGATGTAVGLLGLRMMGTNKVNFIVPNRFTDGYGLSVGVFYRSLEYKPELILTVDNGISAHAGIEEARKHGIPVVVTDHHLPGDTLPNAHAIVNPNQPGCQFASKNIAGVGVMFYLMIAVRAKLRALNHPGGAAKIQDLLDLVAIGTIADVVQLDYNNRLLVHTGLARIKSGYTRPGVLQLFNSAKKNIVKATSEDLGFLIGPRINSAGRMDDASVGINCLSSEDEGLSMRLAENLHATNQERRSVQKSIESEAENDLPEFIPDHQSSICLMNENWHQGIIGVVAGRLKEKFFRPTIIFTRSSETAAKGSARSIPGLHLRDCIDLIDKQNPGLIHKFGGHAAAAGLDIDIQRFEEFRLKFEDIVSSKLTPSDLRQCIEHDGLIYPEELSISNAQLIGNTVWGQGFPSPLFVIEQPFITNQRILNDAHLKLELKYGTQSIDAIWFGRNYYADNGVNFLARLSLNEWNGREKPQLMIVDSF